MSAPQAKLQPASYAEVAPFRSAAAREHVSVSETRGTSWFLYVDGEEIIGLCGLIRLSTGARIKGVWVKPDLRGNGHGRQMTLALIAHATDAMMAPRLEVYAGNPKFYEAMNWKRIGTLPNGAVRLARNY